MDIPAGELACASQRVAWHRIPAGECAAHSGSAAAVTLSPSLDGDFGGRIAHMAPEAALGTLSWSFSWIDVPLFFDGFFRLVVNSRRDCRSLTVRRIPLLPQLVEAGLITMRED